MVSFNIIPINVSVSFWYKQMLQIIFPGNALVSSIISIIVLVSGWYMHMWQIIFSHAMQWYLLILS